MLPVAAIAPANLGARRGEDTLPEPLLTDIATRGVRQPDYSSAAPPAIRSATKSFAVIAAGAPRSASASRHIPAMLCHPGRRRSDPRLADRESAPPSRQSLGRSMRRRPICGSSRNARGQCLGGHRRDRPRPQAHRPEHAALGPAAVSPPPHQRRACCRASTPIFLLDAPRSRSASPRCDSRREFDRRSGAPTISSAGKRRTGAVMMRDIPPLAVEGIDPWEKVQIDPATRRLAEYAARRPHGLPLKNGSSARYGSPP